MTLIVIWGVSAFISAIVAFMYAGSKNRDPSQWAAWCFVLPPLLIALFLSRRLQGPAPRQPTLDELDRTS